MSPTPPPVCALRRRLFIAVEEKNAIFTYSLRLLGRGRGLGKKLSLLLDKGHYLTNRARLGALSLLDQVSKGMDICRIMRMGTVERKGGG